MLALSVAEVFWGCGGTQQDPTVSSAPLPMVWDGRRGEETARTPWGELGGGKQSAEEAVGCGVWGGGAEEGDPHGTALG